jgi:transposase
MRFESLVGRWERGDVTQMEAAEMLGVSVRTFQRWAARFEEAGADGLTDRRLGRASPRRAPQEELERMLGLYRDKYSDFTVKHFHEQLRKRHGYVLGYTVTKLALHAAGLVRPAAKRSAHRKKRPRRPLRGMLLHQDGSRHAWLEGQPALDLIVTLDDATSGILSLFLVAEEGTASTFQGLREVVAEHGLFCALYTDRGSHYFETPKAGGKVSKSVLTQVGRALQQLGIEHIAAYSPEARGRSERLFRTLQTGCRRSCGWRASRRLRRRTPGSGSTARPRTIASLPLRRRRRARRSCPSGRGRGATSCAWSRSA